MPGIHTPSQESWNACFNLLIGGRGLIITIDTEVAEGLLRYCSHWPMIVKAGCLPAVFFMHCSKHNKISMLLVLKNLINLEFVGFCSTKSEVLVLQC